MAKRRVSRMEEAPVQPPAPADVDELAALRARVAELEARPGTPAEWSVLMEAACSERDENARRCARWLAEVDRLKMALQRIADMDANREAAQTIIDVAREAIG